MRVRTVGALLMGLTLVATGCRPEDQRTDSVDMDQIRQERETFPEEGLAELDAGNEAFRADDLEGALDHYRSATEIMPTNAAAWFGIVMAARELGLPEVADSALVRAQDLAPGATLIHDALPDTAGGGAE